MKLLEVVGDESDHWQALAQTGYWGRQGCGALFFAQATSRFGIAHRSQHVEQPGTFGTVGGAIDSGEDPAQAVLREVHEEVGVTVDANHLIKLDVFQDKSFRYTTFLITVAEEFEPRLNWENQGFVWVEYGNWPKPLHFGLAATLSKPAVQKTLQTLIGAH